MKRVIRHGGIVGISTLGLIFLGGGIATAEELPEVPVTAPIEAPAAGTFEGKDGQEIFVTPISPTYVQYSVQNCESRPVVFVPFQEGVTFVDSVKGRLPMWIHTLIPDGRELTIHTEIEPGYRYAENAQTEWVLNVVPAEGACPPLLTDPEGNGWTPAPILPQPLVPGVVEPAPIVQAPTVTPTPTRAPARTSRVRAAELPRTGVASLPVVIIGLTALAGGAALLLRGRLEREGR